MSEFEFVLPEIIKGLKSTFGEAFLDQMTFQLNKIIDADYTFIAHVDMTQYTAKTISVVANGEFSDNFEYGLIHTPCALVVDDSVCMYPHNICDLFPKDQMLIDMNIEGYVGVALHDSNGEILGIIVALYKTKIKDVQFSKTLFELFSGRISAEMERTKQSNDLISLNSLLELKINELIASEARLSIHIQNTPLGCITWDTDFICTEWNQSAEHIFGYSAEEAIGLHATELIVPVEIKDNINELYRTLLEQKGGTRSTNKNTTKDGHIVTCDWYNTPIVDESGTVAGVASLIQDITERKLAEGKLERIANYDLLTDLPNRTLLADRLNQAMLQCQRRNQSLAVAYLDLDGFKIVNDTYGHELGDKLLVALSKRLKKVLREGDTLARIGGDEFIIVLVDLESMEDSEPVLERLLKAAAEPVTVDGAVVQVSASIGVTLYPQDGVDPDQLTRHADQAMYIAKQAGKSRYHWFDTAQHNAIKTQRQSIGDVYSALHRREFVLYYQPKVNMHTGEVIGVEALIRWQHPVRGLVSPLDFLPAIEGHIVSLEIGEWVIDTALNQISQWKNIGIHLPVSVNVSAYQLQQDEFVSRLAALLTAHPGVNPRYLELEILETSAVGNVSEVSDTMNTCRKLGVHFALDDFGTGYSSLTHLRRLPAHLIKIDRSFVHDMLNDTDDLAIVECVIALAKSFKREVIAEGVETIEHGAALLKLGCELAQGFGIAKPMPASDIPPWMSDWKPDASWQI